MIGSVNITPELQKTDFVQSVYYSRFHRVFVKLIFPPTPIFGS
jgi:hypothetical protein